MTNLILYIIWNPSPELFSIGPLSLKYYSIAFMLAFASSYLVLSRMFKKDGKDRNLLEHLTAYVFVGTLIGARLGHCLFYDFAYFSKHPLEIILPVIFSPHFKIIGFSGLASHGAGIGIILSLCLFSRKYGEPIGYLLDRISLVVPLAGTFIRIGNLMNSEIIGKPSHLPWAFIFTSEDNIPRHPSQLYEAFGYLLIFIIIYQTSQIRKRFTGFSFGLLLVLLFFFRLLIEFTKEVQSSFERGLYLDMGQLLSLPFIIFGLLVLTRRIPLINSR